MNLPYFIKDIGRNLLNIPGWRTNRKIVVIESDDWGSIRMASREAYEFFLSKGYPVDQNHYNRYDALESETDIELILNTLSSFRDVQGHHPVLTLNNIVANPDFEKIRNSAFQKYYYEPFTMTYDRYPNHRKSFELLKQGINLGLFKMQYHGREHLNVLNWLSALRKGDLVAHLAYSRNMFTSYSEINSRISTQYLDALNYNGNYEKRFIEDSLIEGFDLFREIWDQNSLSFIAPCYIWNSDIEKLLFENGIKFIQGANVQNEPSGINNSKYRKRHHFTGQQNYLGQYYLVRNAFFEPSSTESKEPVGRCMKEIATAFRWSKPAIIGSHRVNYIGFIDQNNRTRTNKLLRILLKEILMKWPDVEFKSTDELGMILSESLEQERSFNFKNNCC